MIKFTGKNGDVPLFGIGLSARNMQLLKEGRPIKIALKELGGEGEILICYGETEADIIRDLGEIGAFSPDTQVRAIRRDEHQKGGG